jgi:hypothetical protein
MPLQVLHSFKSLAPLWHWSRSSVPHASKSNIFAQKVFVSSFNSFHFHLISAFFSCQFLYSCDSLIVWPVSLSSLWTRTRGVVSIVLLWLLQVSLRLRTLCSTEPEEDKIEFSISILHWQISFSILVFLFNNEKKISISFILRPRQVHKACLSKHKVVQVQAKFKSQIIFSTEFFYIDAGSIVIQWRNQFSKNTLHFNSIFDILQPGPEVRMDNGQRNRNFCPNIEYNFGPNSKQSDLKLKLHNSGLFRGMLRDKNQEQDGKRRFAMMIP